MLTDPTRSRNRAAAVLGVSVALLLAARALPNVNVGGGLNLTLSLAGTIGAPISAVWMLVCWLDGKRSSRLKAGKGVIARWTVDARRWEWFRGQSKGWNKRAGVRPNLVNLDQPSGTAGIEIVVTGDAVLVGDYFCPIEKDVALRTYPGWMEFYYIIPKAQGSAFHVNLRIPLASDGQAQADRIVQVYGKARAAAIAKSPSMLVMFLLLMGGIAGATGLVALLVHLLQRSP